MNGADDITIVNAREIGSSALADVERDLVTLPTGALRRASYLGFFQDSYWHSDQFQSVEDWTKRLKIPRQCRTF